MAAELIVDAFSRYRRSNHGVAGRPLLNPVNTMPSGEESVNSESNQGGGARRSTPYMNITARQKLDRGLVHTGVCK